MGAAGRELFTSVSCLRQGGVGGRGARPAAPANPSFPLPLAPSVCSGRVAGFFGGWPAAEREAAEEFDGVFSAVAGTAKWCCFGWGDADYEYQEFAYGLPTPLAGTRGATALLQKGAEEAQRARR